MRYHVLTCVDSMTWCLNVFLMLTLQTKFRFQQGFILLNISLAAGRNVTMVTNSCKKRTTKYNKHLLDFGLDAVCRDLKATALKNCRKCFGKHSKFWMCFFFTFFHHAFSNPPTILNYCEITSRCKTPSFRWGFHSDLNETFFIGDCDEDSQRLVRWGAVRASRLRIP